jgi:hypothetical protein
MDNLFVGNVVPPLSSGASLPTLLSSVLRLWKSLRNDPGQGSDDRPKVTGLKSESVDRLHPGIVTGFISEW